MVWRSLVMRTRSSRTESSPWGRTRGAATAGTAAIAGAGLAKTSPFSTCARRPVPSMAPISSPLSAAIFAAAGDGGMAVAGFSSDATGWAKSGLASAWTPATGAAFAATAPAVICPSKAPALTVSPSFAVISASTPDAGALTSSVTLSVSSSSSGSSALTMSPGFLNHLPIVASETLSPRVGTRISVAIFYPSPARCSRFFKKKLRP